MGAYLLGRLLVTDRASRHPSFLAGSGVRRAVALLSIIGLLAWLAAVMFGLGAMLVASGAPGHPPSRRVRDRSAGCRPPLAARDVPEPG